MNHRIGQQRAQSRSTKKAHWDDAEGWYSRCVGEKGHYYHQSVVIPNALRLLNLKKGESLLDLGCGQGVLLRHLPKGISYTGVDASAALIEEAQRLSAGTFHVGDATESLPVEKKDFDTACFILSLQNIESPEKAIAQASLHLKKGGKLLLVLNHPCFRIPRQTHWGVDEQSQIQYRRLNLYLSSLKIPIQTEPSRKETSPVTYSFHAPLSSFVSWLAQAHFAITGMEEWCSDKKSTGPSAKREDRARKEFPLFLAILAKKN